MKTLDTWVCELKLFAYEPGNPVPAHTTPDIVIAVRPSVLR